METKGRGMIYKEGERTEGMVYINGYFKHSGVNGAGIVKYFFCHHDFVLLDNVSLRLWL